MLKMTRVTACCRRVTAINNHTTERLLWDKLCTLKYMLHSNLSHILTQFNFSKWNSLNINTFTSFRSFLFLLVFVYFKLFHSFIISSTTLIKINAMQQYILMFRMSCSWRRLMQPVLHTNNTARTVRDILGIRRNVTRR